MQGLSTHAPLKVASLGLTEYGSAEVPILVSSSSSSSSESDDSSLSSSDPEMEEYSVTSENPTGVPSNPIRQLNGYLQTGLKQVVADPNTIPYGTEGGSILIVCGMCCRFFDNLSTWHKHVFKSPGGEHCCRKECDKPYPQKLQIVRKHEKHAAGEPYTLEGLDKSFTYEQKRRKLMDDKPEVDQECHKSSERKVRLDDHLIRHDDVKPNVWQECDGLFKRKSSLGQPDVGQEFHESFVRKECLDVHPDMHDHVKPRVFQECNGAFAYNSTLGVHCHSPAEEMSYQCKQCGFHFAEKGALEKHMRWHYMCLACSDTFTNIVELSTHLMIHIGD
ncbi:putative zinc finger protein 730 [Dermacentor silvarum]|uniref:putative zinc finger protein 730 n=1 Tax=Dermacentor silvarum TaxID=543639 RepID=UPI002101AD8E|nr:putative zinc finger protein 730 [Dermacentor silvarum]